MQPEKNDAISAIEPDWSREAKSFLAWQPSRSLLASLRSYERWKHRRNPIAVFMKVVAVLRHRFWSIVTGAEIPLGTSIGGGFLIPHPNGIVIHPAVVIGPNCLVYQQVTMGAARNGVPRIGGHVDIGAGARILGNVDIGNHSKIGANAVVLHDVAPYATAIGVPAHCVSRTGLP